MRRYHAHCSAALELLLGRRGWRDGLAWPRAEELQLIDEPSGLLSVAARVGPEHIGIEGRGHVDVESPASFRFYAEEGLDWIETARRSLAPILAAGLESLPLDHGARERLRYRGLDVLLEEGGGVQFHKGEKASARLGDDELPRPFPSIAGEGDAPAVRAVPAGEFLRELAPRQLGYGRIEALRAEPPGASRREAVGGAGVGSRDEEHRCHEARLGPRRAVASEGALELVAGLVLRDGGIEGHGPEVGQERSVALILAGQSLHHRRIEGAIGVLQLRRGGLAEPDKLKPPYEADHRCDGGYRGPHARQRKSYLDLHNPYNTRVRPIFHLASGL